MSVRVRFAPSPTGALHIGGVRTALYNYLFAKKNNGAFILRIEDTDRTRFVEGAEKYIEESLVWAGITADESPSAGGEFGPYRQSERKEIYAGYAQQLVNEGKAYYAFDSSEELDAMRERLTQAGVANPQYNAVTRMQMQNALTLSPEEVQAKIDAGDSYVVRIKMPRNEDIRFKDEVRGWVVVNSATLDDKILLKSDGMPTYHLANIVDDHLMEITHVIRGEEWLPSAPLHVTLYEYLGWEPPKMAHLPLLLKPDGNGKLSKRAADKLGFPIFPMNWKDPQTQELSEGFKERGYLKDAFINFLALLGWNPGGEQELFDSVQLIELFSLEKINKSGAKFDIEKAKWFNQQYLKQLSNEDIAQELGVQFPDIAENELLPQIANSLKERVTFIAEMKQAGQFYFERPSTYNEKMVKKKWNEFASDKLVGYASELSKLETVKADDAKEVLTNFLAADETPLGKVMPALRLALTGEAGGPDLMEIIEILGPKEVAERIALAAEKLN